MEIQLRPRFNDTDALGHINNASIATWFEEGRRPIFQYFVPDLDPQKWNLIIARLEIDYLAQGYFQWPVLLKTAVEKIGNSSLVLIQEAWQNERLIARGKTFLVCFDYQQQKSMAIPPEVRSKLLAFIKN